MSNVCTIELSKSIPEIEAKSTERYLGVMVLFIVYEAAILDASLPLEGLMVPVGCSCKNSSLADLANHQYLHHRHPHFVTMATVLTLRR